MIIRKFEPCDFEGVLNIEMEAFTEHNPFVYMNFYEMNNEGFFVASINNLIVGFVMGYQSDVNEGRIFSLAVKKEYQGMKIGSQLMATILNVFLQQGLRSATLEVRVSNHIARKLYSDLGFIECWVEQGYYSDGENGIIMKKQLSPLYRISNLPDVSLKIPVIPDSAIRMPHRF
ncbi:ribosomal protein S18-alanine N-acetyltransferase [Methanococcoides methylutens]|uniref:Ribosomal-protein-S18p-alanine acetyltransferase n=1 Tax=Methanococcoides methylutens MM1 TaxID=1434104 RepID=A0A0E3SNH5_METMT|nr:ribosomal protein S18-alanine N-acetyltransferase [Methanococcoides methylutens]AKB84081.1 Ribosomal-protein-S18p-alanine acetyltransferase [Methanococcoides methylutens MM1]